MKFFGGKEGENGGRKNKIGAQRREGEREREREKEDEKDSRGPVNSRCYESTPRRGAERSDGVAGRGEERRGRGGEKRAEARARTLTGSTA